MREKVGIIDVGTLGKLEISKQLALSTVGSTRPGQEFVVTAYVYGAKAGQKITLGCLRLGDVYLLHMPGELFVEYQLEAQQLAPENFVAMAAYGDYGTAYIGTAIA